MLKLTSKTYKITFSDDLLGTSPNNEDIYRDYIGSKAPDALSIEDEVEATSVDDVADKGMTVFPKTANGTPLVWDYQLRGYFKEACSALRAVPGTLSSKMKAFKKNIDQRILIRDRENLIDLKGMTLTKCERPLRASTAQGERVALACSESVPEGASLTFTVQCLIPSDLDVVEEWLDYGALHGTGQWRNSGKGRFTWEEVTDVFNEKIGHTVKKRLKAEGNMPVEEPVVVEEPVAEEKPKRKTASKTTTKKTTATKTTKTTKKAK